MVGFYFFMVIRQKSSMQVHQQFSQCHRVRSLHPIAAYLQMIWIEHEIQVEMPSCIGGIKSCTGKKAAAHFGFAGYACQTISKTIIVSELTVWRNCIISFLICNLLLQGSIQPCRRAHKGLGLCVPAAAPREGVSHAAITWALQAPTGTVVQVPMTSPAAGTDAAIIQ